MNALRRILLIGSAALLVPCVQAQFTYEVIALANQQVPGEAAGVFYQTLSAPVCNASGTVAFVADTTAPNQDKLILRGIPANLIAVSKAGEIRPGGAATEVFDGFDDLFLGSAGGVIFNASWAGTALEFSGGICFQPSSGPLQLIMQMSAPAPGYPGGSKYAIFAFSAPEPVVTAADTVFFSWHAVNSSDVYLGTALFGGTAGTINASVKTGALIVPGSNVSVLNTALAPVAGTRALVAGKRSTTIPFIAHSNPDELLLESNSTGTGLPGGVSISQFLQVATSADGVKSAFIVLLSGAGVTTANDTAVLFHDGSSCQMIAREGSTAPAFRPGVNLGTPTDPSVNDEGAVVFLAPLAGVGISAANDLAIALIRPTDFPRLVARKGSSITLAGAGARTISGLELGRGTITANRGVVFHANFTNATDANLLALSPVSNPVLRITSKIPRSTSRGTLRLHGTASDDSGIDRVLITVGKRTQTAGGTTAWSGRPHLSPGRNRITVRANAVDGGSASGSGKIRRVSKSHS